MMFFFARIRKEEGDYLVSFPDFPHIHTYGKSLEHALESAKEALNGTLEVDFERGFVLPKPSNLEGKRSFHPIRILPHIEIAYQIRNIRNGHSQSEIARKLGISYQAYQKLENPRKCNPTVKTLERISEVFGKVLTISLK